LIVVFRMVIVRSRALSFCMFQREIVGYGRSVSDGRTSLKTLQLALLQEKDCG
jgi:hypothetical protein